MITADESVALVIQGGATLVGSVAGGGLVFYALRERLRDTFASRSDLDQAMSQMHEHLTRIEDDGLRAAGRARSNDERIYRLEERVSVGASRTDEVVEAIRDIQTTVGGHSTQFAAIEEGLRNLSRSIDLLREDLRA